MPINRILAGKVLELSNESDFTAIVSSTHPVKATNEPILTPVMTLQCHKPSRYEQYTEVIYHVSSISYFPDGQKMVGKEIKKVRDVFEGFVHAVEVSRDGRWVVTAGGKHNNSHQFGELRVCEVETGIVKTLEGHSTEVTCIDISADSTLLASGSCDSILIWGLDTGKPVAGPFKSDASEDDGVGAVRFSQDSKKLAVTLLCGKRLDIWDVHTQKLYARVGKSSTAVGGAWTPYGLHKKHSPMYGFSRIYLSVHQYTSQSAPRHSQQPTFLHYIRKLLPFSRTDVLRPIRNHEPHDPLDFPATLPLPPNYSPSGQATTQGKEHNAAVGAPPKHNDDWIPDEDHVSPPPSPTLGSQPQSAARPINVTFGEHGNDHSYSYEVTYARQSTRAQIVHVTLTAHRVIVGLAAGIRYWFESATAANLLTFDISAPMGF
ncbi:hypothetical protein C8R48DRAFT_670540 [Suillus tomentosus]|nr:hypothetical protein C8R48DRAFT_670540 [Suillus tomentosus]